MLLCLILGIFLGLTSAVDTNTKNVIHGKSDDDSYYPNNKFSDSFDWKLLKELSSKHRNVLLSPISLKLILALLYQGSSGSTERELQSLLQFVDKKSVDNDYSQILSTLQASERSEYLLNMGTNIFMDSGISVNPNFELKSNRYYGTEIKRVNFANSLNASFTINSWVDKITNGKVPSIVKEGDLQETIMLVANAIYFKGTWRHQFPKNQTYFGKFFVNAENVDKIETVTVPYMSTTDTFFIKESTELDARILRLPYKGSDYSMFIILPNSLGGLSNLIKKINLHTLSSVLYALEKRLVEVNIPKFQLQFKTKLAETLQNFGLRQIFQNTASFTGIAKSNSTLRRMLVVSDIIQRTGIELDEEGSVVYSATDINIGNKFGEPREVFNATHPFIFFIEGPNGSILFNGIIEDPLERDTSQLPVKDFVAAQAVTTPKPFVTTNEVVASSSNLQPPISHQTPNLEPSGSKVTSTDTDELQYRFNLFDMELLNVFSETNSNVFISPASVKIVLSMILEGARGSCADEIREALRIPDINDIGVRDVLVKLLGALKEQSNSTYLENSNAIFVSDKYKIQDKYQQIIYQSYDGIVNTISFKNIGNAVNIINNYVAKATHDKIKEIIGSQSISHETIAIITNALYFKGTWKTSFDSEITKTKCFRTTDGCIPTPMMRVSSNFNYNYISRLRVHAVEIPYENSFSMLILLPSEVANIRSVIRDLPHFKLADIINKLRSSEITLEIPKFEFDYSADLVDYLKSLKIREIFGAQANLSGIVENGNVLINSLVHKTRIEVNEQGTVAAAATGAIVIPLMGSTSIIADRPFIFCIYHQQTNMIIFEGILMNPQEQNQKSTRSFNQGSHHVR